ncbi:MAG: hypothetical protein OJI67_17570 [Prosthecobacter sp.]|nr:hypothetical protein [Prosthecobacter sp.]
MRSFGTLIPDLHALRGETSPLLGASAGPATLLGGPHRHPRSLHPDSGHAAGQVLKCQELRLLATAEGVTATAHRIARIIYHMAAKQSAYEDSLVFQLTDKAKARRIATLSAKDKKLGCQIVVAQ